MVKIVEEQGVTVVVLDESYDALEEKSIDELATALFGLAGGGTPKRLVIDFSATQYISSRVLEVLFGTWNRVMKNDGRMVLCNLSPFCLKVLHVTKLDNLWPIAPSRAAAIESIST